MCEHSQRTALELGYRAMQYNLVVSTNEGAIRLTQRHRWAAALVLLGVGFLIVASLRQGSQLGSSMIEDPDQGQAIVKLFFR